VPNLSINSRGYCGPVWSPDGTKMAAIYEGVLAVWSVSFTGEPVGPVRHLTSEIAYAPSWTGDSEHILYQSLDS
jgi:Tol biopolymer transport system component